MQHLLCDDLAQKTTKINCEENTLNLETVTGGKTKLAGKSYPSVEVCRKEFFKKEWELLKKGAVMRNPVGDAGEPTVHIFIGGGYTGCLSFAATPQGTFVYQASSNGREMGTQDKLLCISPDGGITSELLLPGLLPWEICYDAKLDSFLIDLDHYVYQYDFTSATFTKLTDELKMPASFVTIGAGTWAYATHPNYYIKRVNGQPKEMKLDVAFVKGSIPLCASLSPDGEILALNNSEGTIRLIDTNITEVTNTIQGDFGRVEQILWTKDSKQFILHSLSASNAIRFFDSATGAEMLDQTLTLPTYTQDINDCCINAENTLLVCLQRTKAFVFDFNTKSFLYEFPIYHCVKTARVRFIDNKQVGVRTDYGCFSIYQL
jgi:WD40 repeat protein